MKPDDLECINTELFQALSLEVERSAIGGGTQYECYITCHPDGCTDYYCYSEGWA
jgi:hypothetical protein